MQKENIKTSLLLVAITAAIVFIGGYQVNIYDQEDHLPQVYKLLDSNLYINDFFVSEYFKSFNVRFFYVSIVYLVSNIFSVYHSVTILYFLCLYATVWSTYKLSIQLGASYWASLLAALLMCTVFNTFNIGLTNYTYSSFIAGSLASPLCIYALYKFFDNEMIISSIAAGLACLFQVLMGLQIFLLLIIVAVVFYKEFRVKRIAVSVFCFLLFSSAMLIPILNQQFFTESAYDSKFVSDILTYFRNPHHYVPSTFPLLDYVKYSCVVGLGMFSIYFLKPLEKSKLLIIYVTAILGMVVYFIGFEILSINFFAKTQWFKCSIWLTLISVIYIIMYFDQKINFQKLLGTLDKYINYFSIGFITIIIFLLFNSALIPVNKIQSRYYLGNYTETELTKMHNWIRESTDVNALFIVPPNDESFLCESNRSLVVSFKAMIHQDSYLVPWYYKINSIYNVSMNDLKFGSAKEMAIKNYYENLSNIMRKEADYYLANQDNLVSIPSQYSIVHQAGKWILLK